MNNQDKEAFEKWWDKIYSNYVEFRDWQGCDLVHENKEHMRDGWQAACEYKQKEIDELKQELEAAEIAYKSNQQAALLSATLSDKNRELENKVNELYKQLRHEHDLYKKHLKIYEDENAKLRAIVNCLAYADAKAVGATQIYINNARQVLKELEDK